MAKAIFNPESNTIIVRGAKCVPGQSDLLFRNFAGRPTQFSEEGKRNFTVVLTPENAEELRASLEASGLVLNLKPQEDGTYRFKVTVNLNGYRLPNIVRKKVGADGEVKIEDIDTDNFALVDKCLISNADFSCTPTYLSKYKQWACYLNSFMFTPLVDPITEELEALKYAHPTDDEEDPF